MIAPGFMGSPPCFVDEGAPGRIPPIYPWRLPGITPLA